MTSNNEPMPNDSEHKARVKPGDYEPLRPVDPNADLPPAEAAVVERERDILVQLAGRRAAVRRDLSSSAAGRFLDWYARELRESLTPPERARLADKAAAFASRFAQRRALAGTGVTRVDGPPAESPVPESRPITSLVSLGVTARMAPKLDLAVAAGPGRELWEDPCSEWVALPDDVPSGRYLALTARGESMQPLLHSGDVLLVRLGSDLERGAVVVVRHPENGYVVKRVGSVTPLHVELASFNPEFAPVRIPRDASLVLGTVILCWCRHGPVGRQS